MQHERGHYIQNQKKETTGLLQLIETDLEAQWMSSWA